MMKERAYLEIEGGVEVAKDIRKRIATTGVRGLDFEKATKMGVFERMANLMCACHASIMAAYRIYGGIDALMDDLRARKNEIAYEMNAFDRAFERFVRFWTSYYANGKSGNDANLEIETLYHNIMAWAQLPEEWQLGDAQRTDTTADVAIRFYLNDRQYTFRDASISNDVREESETWCVLKYDLKEATQTIVEKRMDKASALMVARRMSDQDKENVYTAAIVRDVVENRTDVKPFKAFKANATIGKITKFVK